MGKTNFKKHFILFCIVGLINTILDLGFYFLLHQLWGIRAYVASPVVVASVMTFSYFMNATFVFSSKPKLKQYVKFMLLTGVGVVLIQTAMSQFFEKNAYQLLTSVNLFQGDKLNTFLANSLVRMSGIVFSLSWNFLFYKYSVFKVKTSQKPLESAVADTTTE